MIDSTCDPELISLLEIQLDSFNISQGKIRQKGKIAIVEAEGGNYKHNNVLYEYVLCSCAYINSKLDG